MPLKKKNKKEATANRERLKEKVLVCDLNPGMYVCELDRPWLETPFLMQGFLITGTKDIDLLSQYCDFVYIDRMRALDSVAVEHEVEEDRAPSFARFAMNNEQSRRRVQKLFPQVESFVAHRDSRPFYQEIPEARISVDRLETTLGQLIDSVHRREPISLAKIKSSINPLVSSVVRNPDAATWLARLKSKGGYTHQHAVATAVWAVAIGREIGLPVHELKILGMGALLLDVGVLQLSDTVLEKSGSLDEEELDYVRSHVRLGTENLRNTRGINERVIEMAACHHERYDGSGYPRGLKGNDIPVYARIAAIADAYDAMTSERPYKPAKSPCEAIAYLYAERDRTFQSELVEQFIQAVGLYPSGTMVELSSGEVAIVVAESRSRRLKPKVLVLTDIHKRPLIEFHELDLYKQEVDDFGKALKIVGSLEPGSYGLRPETIDYKPEGAL